MTPKVSENPEKQAIWEIESSHPELAEKADKALREVVDPEIGLSVIELGLVRNIVFTDEGKNAHVTMIMTTPFCPYAPALLEMTREKAEEALGVDTTIELGMQMWDPSYMEAGLGADWGLY
jgi:metal-sulfur cluster biosynthetic enzyme